MHSLAAIVISLCKNATFRAATVPQRGNTPPARAFFRTVVEARPTLRRRSMANPTSRNEGEGNRTADRNYREATRKFVESERGKEEISKAGDVSAHEASEIEKAEA